MIPAHTAPRSATELFPESLKLSPKQRVVLNTLQDFPQGARASEIAELLGMHVNTARGHLDELVARNAVRVVTAPARGRGRPSLIFQVRVPDNRSIAEEYVALIGVLAEMIADKEKFTEEDYQRAVEIGRRWAQTMDMSDSLDPTVNDPMTPLFRKLRDMGFDPAILPRELENTGSTAVDLHACPFVANGVSPTPFVCAIHDGFLQETLDSQTEEKLQLKLIPLNRNGICQVAVRSLND